MNNIIYLDLPKGTEWMTMGCHGVPIYHPLGFKQHPLEDTVIHHKYITSIHICHIIYKKGELLYHVYQLPFATNEIHHKSSFDHKNLNQLYLCHWDVFSSVF